MPLEHDRDDKAAALVNRRTFLSTSGVGLGSLALSTLLAGGAPSFA